MDMQGNPIGGPSDGTKVTSDPQSKIPVQENPGAIASDSLAAESTRSGGAFSENPNSTPYGVSGSSSTFNTTDTSSAVRLDPAPDADERDAKAAWREASDSMKGPGGLAYPEGAGGQGSFSGTHSDQGYRGGPTGASTEGQVSATGFGDSVASTGSSGNYGTGRGAGLPANADPAPGYITSVVQEPTGGPHGKNLQEGGFSGEPRSGFAEPGSKKDPSRAAIGEFQRANEASSTFQGPRESVVDNENPYRAVGEDRA